MPLAILVLTLVAILAAAVVLSTSWFGRGSQLLLDPPRRRLAGALLVAAGLLLPVSCCFAPSALFRLRYGSPPVARFENGPIRPGMTADEVRGLLGPPHDINDRDPQRVYWLYWHDAITFDWTRVYFGPDETVESTVRE